MARGGHGVAAEQYVIRRVSGRAGWSAVGANAARANQPGFDVVARRDDGRELRIAVKSVSTGGRGDFGIGRRFAAYPADVYAFVDLTVSEPWPVYLAGARTVERLALERHRHYQAARGQPVDVLNTWSPKISRGLLEAMGARECWSLLDQPEPTTSPAVTGSMLAMARADAPRPRQGSHSAADRPSRVRSRDGSDQAYVTDLVDEILGERGWREHRFDWLRGDPGSGGRRVRLPVDAYYPGYRLVVEYHEQQHDRPVPIMDGRATISGMPRGAQRRRYDQYRREQIPAHGLRLLVIRAADLDVDGRGRLRRRGRNADLEAVRRLLGAAELRPADGGELSLNREEIP